MDAEELKKLLEKANLNYESLKQDYDSLVEKVNLGDTGLTALKENYETQIEAMKQEMADMELKIGQPTIHTPEAKNHNLKVIQKAIGAALKSKESDKDILDLDVKTLNLTNTGEGLESVAEILSSQVIERAREAYPIIGLVGMRNMPRDFREEVLVSYPSVIEGIENVAGSNISETETQRYQSIKNRVAKVSGKPRITDEAKMGSDLDLYNQLLRLLGIEVDRKLATQILFGDGTGKNMRGMLSSNRIDFAVGGESFKPTIHATDARDPDFYCVHGTGVADNLPASDKAIVDWLLDIITKTPSAHLAGASWTFNRRVLNRLQKVRDTQERPIFMPDYMGNGARILGYPVNLEDYMPDIAADAPFLMFGRIDRAFEMSEGDVVKMLIDPYTVDGCTVIKVDHEWFEKVGQNDAIVVGVCTTNAA